MPNLSSKVRMNNDRYYVQYWCLGIPHLIFKHASENKCQVHHNLFIPFYMEQKNRQNGGLHVPNILTTFQLLNLAWIPHLLKKMKTVQMNLGCIFHGIILKSMADLTSYFYVITITILLNRLIYHFFYKEIFLHMIDLKQLYGYYQEQHFGLFNNTEILINGNHFLKTNGINKVYFLSKMF